MKLGYWFILVGLILSACSGRGNDDPGLRLGERFPDLATLNHTMTNLGYRQVGRFGASWPARVVEIDSGLNELTFALVDGPEHTYQGYTGYNLVMVRLVGRGGETVVVFRSDRYTDAPDPAIPVGKAAGGVTALEFLGLALSIVLIAWLFYRWRGRRLVRGRVSALRRVVAAVKRSRRKGAYVSVELPDGAVVRFSPLPHGLWLNLLPGPESPGGFSERLTAWARGRELQFLEAEAGSGEGYDLELHGSQKQLVEMVGSLLVDVCGLAGETPFIFRLFRC